jgi:glycosyltransferase involved in cell wall biosynthesis
MKRTGMNPFTDIKTIFKCWSLMHQIKPDYFLAYTPKPVIYGNLAAWFARIPNRYALITGLGFTFQTDKRWLNFLMRNLYNIALSKTKKVFFQNPDDQNLFINLGIVKNKKTIVVNGSGVDINKFKETSFPKTINFLLIARLLVDKGIREYFEAAKTVKKKYPEINFGLVGWIDQNPNAITENELNNLLADDCIEFLGHLDDVRPAIVDSSIYVLPSYSEGTPRTVLEAMSMGRPIITTDAPGCRETVINNKNGFLVKAKSSKDLADAMIRFIEKPELIETMGRHSRIIAEEKYDVKKVNTHLLYEMKI